MKLASQAAEEEAKTYDISVNYFKKMAWARRDFDTLRATIVNLQNGNNNLESIVKLIGLKDPAKSLPSSDAAERFWPIIDKVERALRNLHQDLMDINVDTEEHGSYFLSIQLFENFERNRSALAKQPGIKLYEGSEVFNIQRHDSEAMNDSSKLLLIESIGRDFSIASRTTLIDSRTSSWKVDNMCQLRNLEKPNDLVANNRLGLEQWGCFHSSPKSRFLNIVYHSTKGEWSSTDSLDSMLRKGVYRAYMQPSQIVQLARLILSAHLYLENVRKDYTDPRPQHYRFYQTSGSDDSWNDDNPLVLRPYLAFGFGRRAPLPELGAVSGVGRAQSSSMMELGLILYQVGIGELVDYGSGAKGLQEAKNTALNGLHALDRRVGPIYTEIVQGILEFQAPAYYLLAANDERQEVEYVKKTISALYKLEQMLENTVTAPLAEHEAVPAPLPLAVTAPSQVREASPAAAQSALREPLQQFNTAEADIHPTLTSEPPLEVISEKASSDALHISPEKFENVRTKLDSTQVTSSEGNVEILEADEEKPTILITATG